MTRQELLQSVTIQDGRYIRLADIPAPWRQQFTTALKGSACPLIPGEPACAFAHDWTNWVAGTWYDRPAPEALEAD